MGEVLSIWRGVIQREVADRRTMSEIAADIASRHRIKVAELKSESRRRLFVLPRQETMATMYATGRYSLSQIGLFLGGRDHSTVWHGVIAHTARVRLDDPQTRNAGSRMSA